MFHPLVLIGIFLLFLGFGFYGMHFEAGQWVIKETADRGDGLEPRELWSGLHQFTKRAKLQKLAAQEPRESQLNRMARAALRHEIFGYVFFFIGAGTAIAGLLIQ